MSFNPILPVTYNNATYLFGSDLNANFSTLMANDIDLNARINSIAGGYNQIDLSFSGASLSYSGATYVSGKPVFLTASAITVTGAAGWRYIVCTDAGVISIETIPGGEITADTQQYTPSPIYNSTYNGYYSSVNTAKRIIGICYFDNTNILEAIPYKSGKIKNDDWWYSPNDDLASAANLNDRFQFLGAFTRTRGTNITAVDNGLGTTDSSGFRVTANESGKLIINFTLSSSSGVGVTLNKNGALYRNSIYSNNSGGGVAMPISLSINAVKGDYFTFYISAGSAVSAIYGFEILFERS